jgi:glycine/D-amino acid oxidase-like deaminating enzyme
MADLPSQADVVVVGGGVAGLAAALFLAEGGARPVLLERPGWEPAVPGLGAVWLGIAEHPWRLRAALGDEQAAAFYRFCREGADLAADRLAMARTGGLWVAADAAESKQIDDSVAALTALGVPVERWDEPRVAAAVGSDRFGPGFFCADEGLVDPAAAKGLAQRAEAAGARIFAGSPAMALDRDDRGVIVKVPGGEIVADAVVLAGGWRLRDVDPALQDKLYPYRELALYAGRANLPALPVRSQQGYLSWRLWPDGRMVVSGARWATPHLEEGETVAEVAVAVAGKLQGLIEQRWPGRGALAQHGWSWIDTKSCDGLPIVGPLPGNARVVVCAGWHGQPVSLGLRAARAVADGLLTGRAPGVPRCLEASRFL